MLKQEVSALIQFQPENFFKSQTAQPLAKNTLKNLAEKKSKLFKKCFFKTHQEMVLFELARIGRVTKNNAKFLFQFL